MLDFDVDEPGEEVDTDFYEEDLWEYNDSFS